MTNTIVFDPKQSHPTLFWNKGKNRFEIEVSDMKHIVQTQNKQVKIYNTSSNKLVSYKFDRDIKDGEGDLLVEVYKSIDCQIEHELHIIND